MRGHRYHKSVSVICLMLSVLFVISFSGCGAKDAEDTKPIEEPAVQAAAISDEVVAEIVADFEKQLEGIDQSSEAYQKLIDEIDFASKLLARFNETLTTELSEVKAKVEVAKTELETAATEAATGTTASEKPGTDVPQAPVGEGKDALYDFKIEDKAKGYSLRYDKASGNIYVHYGNLPGDDYKQILNDALATQKPKDTSWHKRYVDALAYKDAAQYMSGHVGPMLAGHMFPNWDDFVKYAGWLHEAPVVIE